jgi:hypothetical protein
MVAIGGRSVVGKKIPSSVAWQANPLDGGGGKCKNNHAFDPKTPQSG